MKNFNINMKVLKYIIFLSFIITSNSKPTDPKLTFSEKVKLYINGTDSILPIPTTNFEERYLQIVLDNHASNTRVINDKEIADKKLKLDKDISILNLYTTVSLVIFSVIFAVIGLVFGLINVGAGTLYPTPPPPSGFIPNNSINSGNSANSNNEAAANIPKNHLS